ncbi:MAG: hypothetical protein HeimC2_11550 [Candidatus Heimdallarchaeota archaeon LC_2]|nr:MAG: hypothetical protein HeimC2_11550 [Candidatus Heimdallarchaeota archaeon LC_2]
MQLLLKRFRINSSLDYRSSSGSKGTSNVYGIHIYGRKDIERFVTNIGSDHSTKRIRFQKILTENKYKSSTTSNRERAPLISGSLIRANRIHLGLKQNDLGKPSTISSIENLKRRTSMDNVKDYLDIFEKYGATEKLLEFKQLKKLVSGEYTLDELKIKKEEIQSNYMIRYEIKNKLITGNGLIIDTDKSDNI